MTPSDRSTAGHAPLKSAPKEAVDAARALEAALSSMPLYALVQANVHPSLAHRGCWFCGCVPPQPRMGREQKAEYLDCVAAEIAILSNLLNGHGRLAGVAFGAGAPAALTPDDIVAVLDAIEISLGLTDLTCVTVEMTLEMIRRSDMRALVASGVRRFTLFAESQMAENVTFDAIEDAMVALRDAAAEDVGVAYIADLPARSAVEAADHAERLLALGPDRLVAHRLGDRVAVDPAFAGVAPPTVTGLPQGSLEAVQAAGLAPAAAGVFVRPERRLERAAALDARLVASQIGVGAGALGRLGGRLFRNARRLDLYSGIVEFGMPPVELMAEAPATVWPEATASGPSKLAMAPQGKSA
ncbi:MAG: radical SAM protein [Parvularculaceae bacterium]|nr:radical SAM protein [Parvularculaceae bacterium]